MDLKEEHNKMAKIENLIWDIAKTLYPNSVIDPKKIEEVKQTLLQIFNK